MWNLKYDTKEPIYETDLQTDLRLPGVGDGRQMKWEVGSSRCSYYI